MPPKTREEVRHDLLETLFIQKLEDEYENADMFPEEFWDIDEAKYIVTTRGLRQYNFTDDEINRASEAAVAHFYRNWGEAFEDDTSGTSVNIFDYLMGIISGIRRLWDDPGDGKEPEGLGLPEAWRRGNRVEDVD